MAMGKPLKKNFYSNSEGGQRDIDMPNMNEQSPVNAAAPDPWQAAQPTQDMNAAAPVPDSVPQDVMDEMNRTQNVYSSNADKLSEVADDLSTTEDSTRDDLSQTEDDEVEEVTPQPKRGQESPANRRIRELKEAQKKAERERDELLRMYQMQQMQQQMPKEQVHQEPEEDINIDDDALIEGKQFRQMYKEMRQMKKELNSYKAQSSDSIAEAKIRAACPDYDAVCSAENIARFSEENPEFAYVIGSSQDLYTKAVAAYKAIKQSGIHKNPVSARDREQVIRNTVKPRPLASVNPQQGDSPLSKANAFANGEFTEETKDQLLREMWQARKNM